MEEKAAEGNVAYFAEYATEELASKLVKYRDEDGRTLLHTAAAAGKLDLVEFFLATDAGRGLVNVSDEEQWTPLHSASSAGHTNVVATLLAFGAHPNAANKNGQRACHYAASKGRLEVLRKLHHAGADCDASDNTGATPCHRAASCGNVDIINFLVNECSVKINLERKNGIGQTPLIVACEAGQNEAVLLLARLGADPDAVDDENNAAATLAPKLLPVLRAIKQGDDGA